MYKLITSSRSCDDLSLGFDRDHVRRHLELTKKKNINGKYHVRIYSKVFFDFGSVEKVTLGLSYFLTLTKNSDNAVLNKGNDIYSAKSKIISIECSVPHYTPSLELQTILSSKNCKEGTYRTSIYMKKRFRERN